MATTNFDLHLHNIVKVHQATIQFQSDEDRFYTVWKFFDEDGAAVEVTAFHTGSELPVVPEE